MFSNKKKLIFSNDELRIIRVALVEFRNELLSKNDYTDLVDEVFVKLESKMKVDKYEIRAIIQGLFNMEQSMKQNDENTSFIDDLLLRLVDTEKAMSKSK